LRKIAGEAVIAMRHSERRLVDGQPPASWRFNAVPFDARKECLLLLAKRIACAERASNQRRQRTKCSAN
jgi:hypothetical protein